MARGPDVLSIIRGIGLMVTNWKPVFLRELYLGETLKLPEFQIFFGSTHSNYANLEETFQKYHWARVKQVHGNQVLNCLSPTVDWTNPGTEADGVITSTINLAAVVLTADCLPVMILDEKRKVVGSVHAGWKGIANRILPECVKEFVRAGSVVNDLSFWIGPHIQEQTFEVGDDVADQLVRSAENGKRAVRSHPVPGKSKINLSELAIQQIHEFGPPKMIWVSPVDTFSDPRYASYRRDVKNGISSLARQMSFIVRDAN